MLCSRRRLQFLISSLFLHHRRCFGAVNEKMKLRHHDHCQTSKPLFCFLPLWFRVSPTRRLCFLFFGLFFIFTVGFVLQTDDGYWLPGAENSKAYFRLRFHSQSPRELAQMLTKSVSESHGTWQCYDDGRSRELVNDDGRCHPTKATLSASLAAHPSVFSRTGLNCQAMFNGDDAEIQKGRRYVTHAKSTLGTSLKIDLLLNGSQDCADFRKKRGYFAEPLSEAEAKFPLAYSILMYNNVPQVERLLRAIYMPQNFYCIHVDIKSDDHTKNSMASIAKCFDNVFIASELESVYWGHISIIYAEMNCMRDLLKYQWKYFINLSGFMYPAHSNRDLVNILRLYDGANDVEGSYKRSNHFWLKARNAFHWRLSQTLGINLLTLIPKSSPPFNVTIYKGSNQAALTREFVVHFIYSRESHDLIKWFADTLAPDEYIWPTLNHNAQLHVPGSYKGDPETKTFTARATIWLPISDQVDWSWSPWMCRGQWVREICIFGVGDLPWLYQRPELFVNKFYAEFEPLAYDCMEELIFNRTVEPFIRINSGNSNANANRNMSYYIRLPFVANKTTSVVSIGETLKYLDAS